MTARPYRFVSRHTALALALQPLAAVALSAGVSPAVLASVTSCGDAPGDTTTLRYAVTTANSKDTINLSGLACGKITLDHAIAVVVDDLTINGPGRDSLKIDGGQADRVFTHSGKGTLGLADLTVTNGKIGGDIAFGGCVYSTGKVSLTRAAVTSCQALGQSAAAGGGISVFGDISADASVITGNKVDAAVGNAQGAAFGGGVFSFAPGAQATLRGSTITGNSVHAASGLAYGGGFVGYSVNAKYSTISGNAVTGAGSNGSYGVGGGLLAAYSLFMFNSTVDSNTADLHGAILIGNNGGFGTIAQSTISSNVGTFANGGIAASAPLSIGNSTIAFNTGGPLGSTGGVFEAGAFTLTVQNSIIADNTPNDIDGGSSVQGTHNVIKTVGPNATLPVGTITADPKLGPLTWNGSPMRTHAIGAASPAVDAGDNPANFTSDQRGGTYERVSGAAADIGAYEFDPDHIFANAF